MGVVPYVPNLNLPEEDSLSFREVSTMQGCEGEIKIVALNTPCLANFTDFDPLLIEPDVSFNMAKQPSDLKAADLIILPGSKSTMADLQYIRDNGFEEELKNAAARGVNIIGICGGFQMLGSEILDPLKIESSQASIAGLGLLQAVTTMAKDKTALSCKAMKSTMAKLSILVLKFCLNIKMTYLVYKIIMSGGLTCMDSLKMMPLEELSSMT